ncbi:MAG: hypothetical protein ABW036_04380 [Flavitalea sp.]
MADQLPTYAFLPWARQGLAVNINENDTLGTSNGIAQLRAKLDTKIDIEYIDAADAKQTASVTKSIDIVGPGDVTGLHQSAIVRVQPKNGITNFESNGLAYIEFYEEDFCWRYSPASPAGTGNTTRLRPWIALVALTDDEFEIVPNNIGPAYISVKESAFEACFHSEKDHWAFAHVHITNKLDNFSGDGLVTEVNNELNADPDMALSRLLCPRKLQKNTHYTCFVIPAFETGRLTGLGIDPAGTAAQTPAWKKGGMPASSKRGYDFPVYHQWGFRTGNYGDFESLAMILKPFVMDREQGKMPMDISDPGFNLQTVGAGSPRIGLEAALKPVDMVKDKWPINQASSPGNDDTTEADIATIAKLKTLLSLSADFVDPATLIGTGKVFFSAEISEDPILVPPVYGVWHALVSKLDSASNPAWVKELNLDFRNRAAAGFGTTMIQKRQEDFMHRAWMQVERVNEANKKIEQAILAKNLLRAIMKKNVINAGQGKVFMLTHAVQPFVFNAAASSTVAADFQASRIPQASKSAAFRKLTRPNTKTSLAVKTFKREISKSLLIDQTKVIGKFNMDEGVPGSVRGAKEKQAAIGSVNLAKITASIDSSLAAYNADPKNLAVEELVKLVKTHVLEANNPQTRAQLQSHVAGLSVAAEVKTQLSALISNITNEPIITGAENFINIQFNHAFYENYFGPGITKKLIDYVFLEDNTAAAKAPISPIASSQTLSMLQSNFTTFKAAAGLLPVQVKLPGIANLEATRASLQAQLSPVKTMASKILSTIKIFKGGFYIPLRKLVPVMAHPEFEEPIYSYLLELSKNYILPNIDKLPKNSITVLQNNQSFIEAFMAGVNHEMSRELLWREYPTDQRGTYFRQFWNISDNVVIEPVDAKKEKEVRLDIKKIHEWDGRLGKNSPRENSDNIVLVIRGELLKKYPNALVYAQQAQYDPANPRKPRQLKDSATDQGVIKFSLFKADIDPDITLFGFDLDPETAQGIRIETPNQAVDPNKAGWFFVLKERPGQVNFGLDDLTDDKGNDNIMPAPNAKPNDWNDLAWEYLVNTKTDLQQYHLSFNKTIVPTNNPENYTWASNAADIAAILLQDPALLARHAAEMLPE